MGFPTDYERAVAEVAAKTAYSTEAFLFLLYALQAPTQSTTFVTHIDAELLCWNLRDLACHFYGTMGS